MRRCFFFLIPMMLLCGSNGPAASGGDRDGILYFAVPDPIEPKHVYALSRLVRQEVEAIRYIMGCPKTRGAALKVAGAAPREVYYQAVSLYNKTTRLHYNLLSTSRNDLPEPPAEIRPANVWGILILILDQLREIKKEYRVTMQYDLPGIEDDKTPSDVYISILSAIRQLNHMLYEQPYTPSDVFQEITTAFYYLLNIYQKIPGTKMLKEPAFVPGKIPLDVYREVVETYKTVTEIMKLSGFKSLDLVAAADRELNPSDVFDLAVLTNSEIKYLHSRLPSASPVYEAVYPGVKFPAHVYQRVAYLHNHLMVILSVARDNPQWFENLSRD